MATYDLIVIGAGSVGAPAALASARMGMKTLVIDANASAGQGENKTAIGGVRATHSDPAKIQICLRSIDIFNAWRETEGDDLGVAPGGYLFPVYAEAHETMLKGLLTIQKRHGLNIDWIEPDRVRNIVPGIREAGLRGGTYSPGDINVSPLRTASAYFFAAQRAGVEFRFREKVSAIRTGGGRVEGVVTDKGAYSAPNVLNAAGAHAREIGAMAGIDLPVYPDSHEAGITEPVQRIFDPLIVDLRTSPGCKNNYFYQNSENRIVFCLTPDPVIPGTARNATSAFLPLVSRKMVDLIPKLANVRVRRVWCGLYPQTPDGNPIVGGANRPKGYYYAVGMCGQGFMLGPGLAADLASLIAHGKPLTDPDVFARLRLERDFSSAEALK